MTLLFCQRTAQMISTRGGGGGLRSSFLAFSRPSHVRRSTILFLPFSSASTSAPASVSASTNAEEPKQPQATGKVKRRKKNKKKSALGPLPPFTLFNSLSGKIETVLDKTANKHKKGMACYTCGPTVYAPAHLGHARTYVWLDILRRCIEYYTPMDQPAPLFVLNITDVDDKILNTAKENNETPLALSRRYEGEFWKDWDALNCLRPHIVTRVTEHVTTDIIPYIKRIIHHRMAYRIENPSDESVQEGIYFDVRNFDDLTGQMTKYGKLAPPSQSETLYAREAPAAATANGDEPESAGITEPNAQQDESTVPSCATEAVVAKHVSSKRVKLPKMPPTGKLLAYSEKRDPRDFCLWKMRKPDEQTYWASPWGDGRPGWHIECSAMLESVQEQHQNTHNFTMHAGGVDLKFPHHTNEIAQAEAYDFHNRRNNWLVSKPQDEWIRHWVHTGHLNIDGAKMSKSLKNFITIKEMLSEGPSSGLFASPADDFRLWCLGLSGSYRGSTTYSKETMQESTNVRQKIVLFLKRGERWLQERKDEEGQGKLFSDVKKWRQEECDLFSSTNCALAEGRRAMLTDLDGSIFVEEVVGLVKTGTAYLDRVGSMKVPVEPMELTLKVLRDMLSLVGFSDATCNAGLSGRDEAVSQNVVGGERALLDEFTAFRSKVRRAALDDHRDRKAKPSENMKAILKWCDKVRDKVFPLLGVELYDGNILDRSGKTDAWQFCTPKDTAEIEPPPPDPKIDDDKPDNDVQKYPTKEMFKHGPYTGLFSAYDGEGFPLRYADGRDLTKTMIKKLRKKQFVHKKRWTRIERKRKKSRKKKQISRDKLKMRDRIAQLTAEKRQGQKIGDPYFY